MSLRPGWAWAVPGPALIQTSLWLIWRSRRSAALAPARKLLRAASGCSRTTMDLTALQRAQDQVGTTGRSQVPSCEVLVHAKCHQILSWSGKVVAT